MLFIQLCNCIGIVSRGHQQLMEVMDRSVRLHLCRDIEALMIRFLSGFTVDGLSKPWWAFAAGKYRTFISLCIQYNDYIIYYVTKNKKKNKTTAAWKKHVLPRIYGVPAAYLSDDYIFLLVKKFFYVNIEFSGDNYHFVVTMYRYA